jgi:hypothetical protein
MSQPNHRDFLTVIEEAGRHMKPHFLGTRWVSQ